ncbi:DUF421 domain-containing protein [Cytobacillus sp. NCCP-133]|uniref:DUF421 domain-containing protein n=1 Tax=Cytobacillus sp. NCCP-133 TaxID=766848 RepID=UPI002230D57D|nr:YetF domain-containing protein [Cytobacillus sp. NCCP-133]GLB59915.1 DUF421 domain-containing protein [Cytobacillus sp. NCCP-133]
MFSSNWQDIGRVLLIGLLSYVFLVLFLRIAGKRTLSKMNAFDLVVTVALGSTLATILLNKKVSLAEGLTAFALLIGLQYIVAWLSIRSSKFSELIKSNPDLLYYKGKFIKASLKKNRVLEVEVLQTARAQGISSLDDVKAVVLETDGNISVLTKAALALFQI